MTEQKRREQRTVQHIPTRDQAYTAVAIDEEGEFELEEDEAYYDTRLPTSARRYTVSPEEVYQSGNTRYHVRYVDVPPRKSRQALQAGSSGNIQAGDVNTPIALAVFVRNNQFTGGRDARSYTTVTQDDIHSISTVLKTTLAHSITGALQSQAQPPEQLFILPCTPTITSDHQAGEEATAVTVTVSQTCIGVAYTTEELATKATALLTERAHQKTGPGYSLFGTVYVSVKQARVTSTQHPLVFLTFFASGSWVYALNRSEQLHITSLIAGKRTHEALQQVVALPGVKQSAIRFTGIGDPERLPKNIQQIHLVLLVS